MIQKIFSVTIGIIAIWAFQRFESLIAVLIIGVAIVMYRGAAHGQWFYFGLSSPEVSDSAYKERDYTDLNGSGD